MAELRGPAISRRLGILVLAGAVVPVLARADGETPLSRTLSPQPNVPPPGAAPTGSPLASAPAVPGAIDKSKTYYVFFSQNIDAASMRALRRQLTLLVEAGVTRITIVINSLGGAIGPMLITYSFIRALPATIDTHVQSIVASAATMLFLAGQQRSADRNARFLFHPIATTIAGTFDSTAMRDQMDQLAVAEDTVLAIYKDRTKLSDQELQRFDHGQVTYDADQARRSGVIQTVADLKIPGDQAARMVFLD